ncbi:MAG: EscU/YscU/HrcU family type III secretion system export apparatus switch protein [Desulfobacterales bacterium]|nr:EscU/YscU/HrcU family type III secretion system export apparatus switch protein [Desulfobacterales bacterium]
MNSHPKRSRRAVALRYDAEQDQAPRVVAKGRGYIAEQIIQAARAHDIPLVVDSEMSPLLEALELDAPIPPEFYLAIAEILAFVYRINDRDR